MSSVTVLAFAPWSGASSVTVHCKAAHTHTHTGGNHFRHFAELANTQKREQVDLLIGSDGEGAGTGSAGVASIRAGG